MLKYNKNMHFNQKELRGKLKSKNNSLRFLNLTIPQLRGYHTSVSQEIGDSLATQSCHL